jgi:hypothetical protein
MIAAACNEEPNMVVNVIIRHSTIFFVYAVITLNHDFFRPQKMR